jgi:hypothetical protein
MRGGFFLPHPYFYYKKLLHRLPRTGSMKMEIRVPLGLEKDKGKPFELAFFFLRPKGGFETQRRGDVARTAWSKENGTESQQV